MDSEKARWVIDLITNDWLTGEYVADRLSYSQYSPALAMLQDATNNLDRTADIFAAIINQAAELDKSSDWVKTELKFEAMAQFVESRTELALLEINHRGPVDDASLDLYNERLNRFNTNG